MVEQMTRPSRVVGRWVPMTFAEFLDWAPDESQAEWVDGKGIIYMANSFPHGILVEWLGRLLGSYVELTRFGLVLTQQALMRLPTRPSGRMPDILVIANAERYRITTQWLEGPGTFVGELLSEDDPDRDLIDKRAEYEAAGVPEYLIIDARPGKRWFRFLRLGESGRYEEVPADARGRYQSTAVPGFWFDPEWFWQDPLPDVDELLALIAPEAYRVRAEVRLRHLLSSHNGASS